MLASEVSTVLGEVHSLPSSVCGPGLLLVMPLMVAAGFTTVRRQTRV
jgi:hypothetical protein